MCFKLHLSSRQHILTESSRQRTVFRLLYDRNYRNATVIQLPDCHNSSEWHRIELCMGQRDHKDFGRQEYLWVPCFHAHPLTNLVKCACFRHGHYLTQRPLPEWQDWAWRESLRQIANQRAQARAHATGKAYSKLVASTCIVYNMLKPKTDLLSSKNTATSAPILWQHFRGRIICSTC